MVKIISRISIASILLIVSACSNSPSVGEQMIEQGSNTKELGQKWTNGNELIKKGNKNIHNGESLIKKGENSIKKGKAKIHEGQSMVKKGHKMINKSETGFHDKFPDISNRRIESSSVKSDSVREQNIANAPLLILDKIPAFSTNHRTDTFHYIKICRWTKMDVVFSSIPALIDYILINDS